MHPQEIVVYDALRPCSYLPGRTARLPYRHPLETLTPDQFDQRLAAGDRRTGTFLYRTKCPACSACEPLRVPIHQFHPSSTQRRIERRGDQLLQVKIQPPAIDEARVALFNNHREVRGLTDGDDRIDQQSYAEFLTDTCCQTIEFSYWHQDRLVAVSIADVGREALSAVYCFFDPWFSLLSLGTYSVLRQIEHCRQRGHTYLYLGFFIAPSRHMVYKANFRPHQRLIRGQWTDFA